MKARRLARAVIVACVLGEATPVFGQSDAKESVMITAGRWAAARLPSGSLRLDPDRSDGGVGPAFATRVAAGIGARLGRLEDMRVCVDVMDPSTCRLECDALLAISPPAIRGDHAAVRVYAWLRQSSPQNPIARASWDLRLQRTGNTWNVRGATPR